MDTRIFVHKKEQFQVESESLAAELRQSLSLKEDFGLTKYNLYDIFDADENDIELLKKNVCSEVVTDDVYDSVDLTGKSYLAYEFLPGQYDQRADSAMQCLMLLNNKQTVRIHSGTLLVFANPVDEETLNKITHYIVNPVEARVKDLSVLVDDQDVEVKDVPVLEGFTKMSKEELDSLRQTLGLAMSQADIEHVQRYFEKEEKRDCTMTELRVLDTYWSDHCRHTTFETVLDDVSFHLDTLSDELQASYDKYLKLRQEVHGNRKEKTLMDMATIAGKYLRKQGKLDDMEITDEINACSVEITVDVDGKDEQWLLMFKNETHNHPTEIEPFGGAATCLRGAIRDPLSGRAYVYQAMRVTGSGDPTLPFEKTMKGKLPSRKITTGAAQGYSSYGNQIGLATGQVTELYDMGYAAKRLEIGAVIGASPKENVVRGVPSEGDIIVLLGGRTGRDGCGGATGSSKAHTLESIETCGAEVQKGNPPTERKIQRLFRNEKAAKMIKRCNDFGAGGVCVAIGELADGLDIDLDKVRKKYDGLDGTELAISESQERMAVVLDKSDVDAFIALAGEENLEAYPVAIVAKNPRLTMKWRGDVIVSLSREFLNTNGVTQVATSYITAPDADNCYRTSVPKALEGLDTKTAFKKNLSRLECCSQRGLVERFDASIGAATVMMPFGGKTQLTPEDAMAAKLPLLKGETDDATAMSYGYIPGISRWSPFHGAAYAVTESLSKLAAIGADPLTSRLTFQEYFERLHEVPSRWGKPTAALLGALTAQINMGIPSIGGKDSMSGSFEDLDVPPTLVSFAVAMTKASKTISAEFKKSGSKVVYIPLPEDKATGLPAWEELKKVYKAIYALANDGKILAASVVREGGAAATVARMSFGNKIGFEFKNELTAKELFAPLSGSFVVELADGAEISDILYYDLGTTVDAETITVNGETLTIDELIEEWNFKLEGVFPTKSYCPANEQEIPLYTERNTSSPVIKTAKPKVFIPVFPGTNCEIDTARAFEKAGAEPELLIVKNLTPAAIEETISEMVKLIDDAQMVMLPGGFSGGDEPDGSGKFIATTFRNPRVSEAVARLLNQRDGLMLGICNGFQALIKLGLVPYGEIRELKADDPTLTFNTIGRHISHMAYTRVTSTKSPWFSSVNAGDVFSVPISHGEGRFVVSDEMLQKLIANGQIATQYVDLNGKQADTIEFNPNGSVCAIEGITSPDGRVLGKMGHSERKGDNLYKNVPFEKDQKIFESGVKYFK